MYGGPTTDEYCVQFNYKYVKKTARSGSITHNALSVKAAE